MNLTLGGIVYRETTVDGVVAWVPVEPEAVDPGESLLTAAAIVSGPRTPLSIHRGDTPAIVIAGRDVAGRPVSVASGWTCQSSVRNARGVETVSPRAIVETTTAGAVTGFVARLTESESLLLDSPLRVPSDYQWLIELADTGRISIHTLGVRLSVSAA